MRIVKGDKYEEMTEAVKQRGGYCPCKPQYAIDMMEEEEKKEWKCLCKEFLEQEEVGHCHCFRYRKTEVD